MRRSLATGECRQIKVEFADNGTSSHKPGGLIDAAYFDVETERFLEIFDGLGFRFPSTAGWDIRNGSGEPTLFLFRDQLNGQWHA